MERYIKFLIVSIAMFFLIFPAMGAQIKVGDGSFALASGDVLQLTGNANGANPSGAFLWMFTYATNGNIYGSQINISSGEFTSNVYNTKNFTPGKYPLVIEFSGKNGIQEVLYDPINNQFTSPWRNPKPIKASDNPYERIHQIESFCKNNSGYCDDTFYSTNVTIENPFIKLTDMYQYSTSDIYQGKSMEPDISKSGMLLVGGTTNINPATTINITLDYNQTTSAEIIQNPYGYYSWKAFLDISKLRTGTHKILISSSKTEDFIAPLEIEPYIPTPKPTPTSIKVIGNALDSSAQSDGMISITPKPVLTMIQSKQFVSVIGPTPAITEVDQPLQSAQNGSVLIAPKKTNAPSYSDVAVDATPKSSKIPIDPIFIVIALAISIAIYALRKKI